MDEQSAEQAAAVSSVDRINLYEQFKTALESKDDNEAVDYFLNMEMTAEQKRGTLNALVEAMVDFMQDKNQTVAARRVTVSVVMSNSQLKRLQDLVFHSKHAMALKIETVVEGQTTGIGVTDATLSGDGPKEYKIDITYYCVERLTEPPFIRDLRIKQLQKDSNISAEDASEQLEQQAEEEATSTFDAVAEMESVYDNEVTTNEPETESAAPEPVSVPSVQEAGADDTVGSVGEENNEGDGSIETDATAAP